MRFVLSALSICLPVLLFALSAQAWGPLGHRASALIAEDALNPRARAAVQSILGGEKLVDAAMWADHVRNLPAYQHTAAYHYEGISDGQTFENSLQRLPREARFQGGAVSAILRAEDVLRDPGHPLEAKRTALRLLLHFVADLHQPLHTGRPEDRGGNDTRLRWGPRTTSLHALWDSQLITTIHADIAQEESEEAGPAVELARRLSMVDRSRELRRRKPGDLAAWLRESVELRPLAYDPRAVSAPDAYIATVRGPLETQLYLSGLRAAEIMNRIFNNRAWTAEDLQTRAMMERILSRLDQFVFVGLKPKP